MTFVPEVTLSPNFSLAKCLIGAGYRVITGATRVSTAPFRGTRHISYPAHDDVLSEASRHGLIAECVTGALPDDQSILGLCGSDRTVRILEKVAKLNPKLSICYPSQATRALLTSKSSARSAFSKAGLPIPPGRDYVPGMPVDIESVSFPAVFKYNSSEGSIGVHIVEGTTELHTFIAKANFLGIPFVIEDFIGPTQEISYSFFLRAGRIFPLYGLKKEFHFRPSYSTTIRFLDPETDQRLFSGFHQGLQSFLTDGFYCAQFKESAGGLMLIEINGRPGNNFRIISRVLPNLAALIVAFYDHCPYWEQRWREVRGTVKETCGCSIVEDTFARMAQVARFVRNGRVRDGMLEVLSLLTHYARRPVVDDYALALFSSPTYAVRYYVSFFSAAYTERKSTAMLKRLVSR